MKTCGHCLEGWVCEDHPDLPVDHDRAACGGAGMPCEHPDCPPVTDIFCRACRRPVAILEDASPLGLLVFRCPACDNVWFLTEKPNETKPPS